MNTPRDVPVTVVGGFLGAGKTTLVNHIIHAMHDTRVGVLVNDFGELAIDKKMIVASDDDVIALTNGCICCSMRGGVMSTVYALLERPDAPEHLVVEASGVSDPRTLAEMFIEAERTGAVRLDALIGVVDAERFDSKEPLARAQIQATDLAILNKTDLVSSDRLEAVEIEVRAIAPEARLVRADHGQVPLEVLLGAGGGPARAMGHVHGIEASGFDTWTYRRDRPIPFRSILPVLTNLPSAVYRVKGVVDFVERAGQTVLVQIVGRRLWVHTVGERKPDDPHTALSFIARAGAVDRDALRDQLDAL